LIRLVNDWFRISTLSAYTVAVSVVTVSPLAVRSAAVCPPGVVSTEPSPDRR
jgi:hypothetical protein